MSEKAKTVSIFNASKVGRRYDLKNGVKLFAGKAVDVPEDEASFLLSKLSNGRPRFPDLMDSANMNPAEAEKKKALQDENAKLLAENEALKKQLAAASKDGAGDDGEKGEKGKDGKSEKGGKAK